MGTIYTEGIISVFRMDTLVCATQGLLLEHYQMTKHSWTSDQQREFQQAYLEIISAPKDVVEKDSLNREEVIAILKETHQRHANKVRFGDTPFWDLDKWIDENLKFLKTVQTK